MSNLKGNTMRMRWGDNDRYLGPFTYARDSQGYRPLAVVLGSGDGEEHPGCRLRLSAMGHTLIVALPSVIQPWRRKIVASSWDPATIHRMGRNWYWDQHERQYGFSCSEGFLQVFLGRQTHDSSTEQSWSYFPPWTQWRFVRHSLYGLDGALVAHLPHGVRWNTPEYEAGQKLQEACPKAAFAFSDFDGQALTATTKIEEREWRFGTKWCVWLSMFCRPKVRRSLDIEFSGETGRRKGSWKGGTIGTGIDVQPGELHEPAFRRYCAEHEMTFVGTAQ